MLHSPTSSRTTEITDASLESRTSPSTTAEMPAEYASTQIGLSHRTVLAGIRAPKSPAVMSVSREPHSVEPRYA